MFKLEMRRAGKTVRLETFARAEVSHDDEQFPLVREDDLRGVIA